MISVENRTHGELDNQQKTEDQIARSLWTAIPGIVESVDYQEQTVAVQPTIREKVNLEGEYQWVELPKLIHVPFFIYSGGGYTITMPIQPGDECLVVFADMCIDAWWQSGGIQNQIDRRRHDLSDGFAICGFKSQPNTVPGYSGSSVQIKSGGHTIFDITASKVTINADVTINGSQVVSNNHKVGGTLTAGGINMNSHTHRGDSGGSTGGPR
nr:MAG TPA: baseplate component [Caudoviricetes sp.]